MIVAKVKHQQVFNMGDFIVQIRNHLSGNKETMSKTLEREMDKRARRREVNNRRGNYHWRIRGNQKTQEKISQKYNKRRKKITMELKTN